MVGSQHRVEQRGCGAAFEPLKLLDVGVEGFDRRVHIVADQGFRVQAGAQTVDQRHVGGWAARDAVEQHVLLDEDGEKGFFRAADADVALQLEPDIVVVEGEQVVSERLDDADDFGAEEERRLAAVRVLDLDPAEHGAEIKPDRVGELCPDCDGHRLAGRYLGPALRGPFAADEASVVAQVLGGQKVAG